MPRRFVILVVSMIGLVGLWSTGSALAQPVASPSSARADETPSLVERGKVVAWYNAYKYVGKRVTVRGKVVDAKYARTSSGRPTFLNLGRAYPNQRRFTVVIWGKNRWRFPSRPERYYLGETVLVNGLVRLYRGSPQMTLVYRSRITVL
jgi:DNA/RNA endonuclease YhcR with UshA esterase domain